MFAKILDSEKYGQILVTKEYDSEEDALVVAISFEFESTIVKFSLAWHTKEDQEAVFNGTDLEKAEETIETVLSQYKD